MQRDLWAELAGIAIALGGVLLFVGILDALDAFQAPEELTRFDLRVAAWMGEHVQGLPFLVGFGLAHAGSAPVVVLVVTVAAAISWRGGRRLEAVAVAGGAVFLQVLVVVLKHGFGRARPDVGLVVEHGYSFPSGHAAFGAYLAVVLVWFTLRHGSGWRRSTILLGVAAAWALAQAAGRVLIGVHYVSDVLAGLGVGMAVGGIGLAAAPFAGRIASRLRRREPRRAPG